MNKLFSLLLGVTLTLVTLSCKEPTEVVNPGGSGKPSTDKPTARPGKVYTVGKPLGNATTTTIGPQGGKLTSADERLTITVPAGAVETAQTFSIQPISSTGPQSLGAGFRLAPHGTTFKKPVTITVRYDPALLLGTVAEALSLAYQNSKGVWVLAATSKVNTDAHTLSVETTHFSDWSVLQRAVLMPEVGFVKPGGNLVLSVNLLTEDLLVPIVQDTDVPEPFESPSTVVDYSTWKLAGEGKLVPAAFKASYTAPSVPPARNPVAISIKLNGPTVIDGKPYKELWLVSNVYIGAEGLTYRINGGKWVHTLSGAGAQLLSTAGGAFVSINTGGTDSGNLSGVNIQAYPPLVESEVGTDNLLTYKTFVQPWRLEGFPSFNLSDKAGELMYLHQYRVGRVLYASPGALSFYRFGPVGDYVIGKFELEKAGVLYPGKEMSESTVRIEGFFRIKRTK
ncbi:hypothetical protein GCM10023189_60570 [Nibrella saemangeumensis]|uniref:ZU5 domain-containing protein n=1 Tax=Nibrella saemangeumensis TaxID=1084526 RepID=A0ABP8NT81_9BACT